MTTDRYTVTTFDVCVEGFERLRNRDEFILVAYINKRTNKRDMRNQFLDDIQAVGREDEFDYDAARVCVENYIGDVAMASVRQYMEGECNAYLYIRDNQANGEC